MKTIKFISNDPQQKNFALEVKKRVNEYFKSSGISTRGNSELYSKTIIMFVLYIAPFIILLTVLMQAWLALVLVIIMGIGEAGIGMSVMHDAAHSAYSRKPWVNKLFSSSMFLLGSNTFNWKIQHNVLHHTYTNIYGFDQDIETKSVIRLSRHAPLKKVHRYQYIYAYVLYGLMTLSKIITDVGQLAEFTRSGFTRAHGLNPTWEMIKLILIKITYFGIFIGLPLWLTDFSWWQVLLGFAALHVTAGMIMSTIFQTAHVVEQTEQPLPDKDGIIHNEWAVHQLRTTSDFARNNRLLGWYIGGLNFQIEHHLFANISHVHYKHIAPIVEQTAREFGLPYYLQPSFRSAFYSHVQKLKILGQA